MATSELERMLDDRAIAWSFNNSYDPERVLALFVDDCVFEDVTFGVVARGKEELRSFVKDAFAAIPDFKYGLTRRFRAGQWAVIEWVMSGTHKGNLPGIRPLASAFRRCGARASSNWRPVRSVARLTIGMQLRS